MRALIQFQMHQMHVYIQFGHKFPINVPQKSEPKKREQQPRANAPFPDGGLPL